MLQTASPRHAPSHPTVDCGHSDSCHHRRARIPCDRVGDVRITTVASTPRLFRQASDRPGGDPLSRPDAALRGAATGHPSRAKPERRGRRWATVRFRSFPRHSRRRSRSPAAAGVGLCRLPCTRQCHPIGGWRCAGGMRVGYRRVSRRDQHLEAWHDALAAVPRAPLCVLPVATPRLARWQRVIEARSPGSCRRCDGVTAASVRPRSGDRRGRACSSEAQRRGRSAL